MFYHWIFNEPLDSLLSHLLSLHLLLLDLLRKNMVQLYINTQQIQWSDIVEQDGEFSNGKFFEDTKDKCIRRTVEYFLE